MFRTIFLERWIPALITAGVGGVLVALIVPGIQSHYAAESALKERRLELWESIGSNFKQVPSLLLERKENYRVDRDRYASQLNQDLILAPFYFGKPVSELVSEYRVWITQHAMATAETMPSRSEFDAWRDRFMHEIRAQLDSE
jgi:hypothetical protein